MSQPCWRHSSVASFACWVPSSLHQVSLKNVRLPPYGSAVGTNTPPCLHALITSHHVTTSTPAARQPAPLVEVDLADGRTLRTRLLVCLALHVAQLHSLILPTARIMAGAAAAAPTYCVLLVVARLHTRSMSDTCCTHSMSGGRGWRAEPDPGPVRPSLQWLCLPAARSGCHSKGGRPRPPHRLATLPPHWYGCCASCQCLSSAARGCCVGSWCD